jgi:NAD-dependent dihydropyrimidine dehydrogenase PreA subunit
VDGRPFHLRLGCELNAMSKFRYLPNVTTLQLDATKCSGCGMCTTVCPHAVFALEDRKARIADRDACMECGACAKNCPTAAISVKSGVGCATAIIIGALRGTEPDCGCAGKSACCE